ncbi:helix-turn-helix transcriptional regulator [Marinovum sp.]|uniref:helix-turn-helix transcriptional regulator n=1 Tax=Marinovum sp. TaxID=2024839 RepID=UPI002B271EAE|nr:helix-turn-helix transcriptional regulator [Marinovum sp.]
MLDSAGSQSESQSALIDTIYASVVDQNDLEAALRLIAGVSGAEGVRLDRIERGCETALARFGLCDDGLQRVRRLNGPVNDAGQRLALSLYARTWAGAKPDAMTGLLMHLDRAVSLSTRLGSAEVERSHGSALLGRLAIGTVFLDAERRIVAMTGAAETMIARGDGLRLRAGTVQATCGTKDRSLQAAIRAAAEAGQEDPAEVLQIHRRNSEATVGLVIQPVTPTPRNGNIACAITIRDGEANREPQVDMLRRLFDLTPAEAVLTGILSMGHTLDEASDELAISRNTARAHLRSIFSKCGINRQTELVRLVLGSVAMLGGGSGKEAA